MSLLSHCSEIKEQWKVSFHSLQISLFTYKIIDILALLQQLCLRNMAYFCLAGLDMTLVNFLKDCRVVQ